MSRELPGRWGELLGPRGVHSYRDLEARTGIPKGTLHRLVTGGATSAETVNRLADAIFDGDRDLVWRLRGSRLRDHGDWSLPAEASLLTEAQRAAVLAVIQAMVPVEQEERDGDDRTAAPMKMAARKTGRLTQAEREAAARAAREVAGAVEGESPDHEGGVA